MLATLTGASNQNAMEMRVAKRRYIPVYTPNLSEPCWGAVCIPLTHGMHTVVDIEDYELAISARLSFAKSRDGYARFGNKQLLHRVICGTPQGMLTDHINGNTLDNRRCNLRAATPSQNAKNRIPKRGGTSNYLGVSWSTINKKWEVYITVAEYKTKRVGRFFCEHEAALAYNQAASRLYGEFARLNIIQSTKAPSSENEPGASESGTE